jgi:hypothetical protein
LVETEASNENGIPVMKKAESASAQISGSNVVPIILLVLAVLVVGVIVLASQADANLSPKAKEFIGRLDEQGDSQAYLFLSGFYAHANDSPVDVGRALWEASREREAGKVSEAAFYDEAKKIPLPGGEWFCPTWEEGCLEHLFSESFDIGEIHREHKVLMERLTVFHRFKEYKTLAKPNLIEVYPPFSYIAAGERIRVLTAISAYKAGDASAAINSLVKQLAEIRRSLTLQDNLIGKMVFLMKFSEVVDVLSIMHLQSGQPATLIPMLTTEEKDFTQVIAREFGMSYYGLLELDRHPGFFQEDGSMPGWVVRVLYKPNMSINAIEPLYSEAEYLMQLTPAEFAGYLEERDRYIPSTSKIRNYAGSALLSTLPNFDPYIARFKGLDAKLILFNQRYHHLADLRLVKNPFYPDESPQISVSEACFRGPLEDVRYLRCVRI